MSSCHHSLALKAVNMKRGEIYGYPLYLVKHHMVQRNVSYCFADVMCKLWPFIMRVEPDMKEKIIPALSVMHAKGHSLQCQVNCCHFLSKELQIDFYMKSKILNPLKKFPTIFHLFIRYLFHFLNEEYLGNS